MTDMKRFRILNTLAVVALLATLSAFVSNGSILNAGERPVEKYSPSIASQCEMPDNNNDFACNLFRALNEHKQGDSSIIVSPISVSYMLGMLGRGADGETRRQINEVLGLGGSVQEINEYFKKVMDEAPNVDPAVTVKIANCIEVNSSLGIRLIPQYKADMKKYYNAQVDALDFTKDSSLRRINKWCNGHTDGMIPSILDELDSQAIMYLLNAVYFKAPWAAKFDPGATRDMDFTKQDGSIVKRPMMHLKTKAAYAKNDLCEMLRLPYGNGDYSIFVMLPCEGKTVGDIIRSLSAQELKQQRMLDGATHEVDILIPRFTTESETKLENVLSSMGMPRAFTRAAEFPNMTEGYLLVSMIMQKAKIEVNEEGTKAAAVTVSKMVLGSGVSLDVRTFHATHPFVYYIVEGNTGSILFMGTYCGD